MTAFSPWVTSSYELVIDMDSYRDDRQIELSVFPRSISYPEVPDDTPQLWRSLVYWEEVGYGVDNPPPWKSLALAMNPFGGVVPEDLERILGPQMAVRALLGLFKAAQADFNGLIEGERWKDANMDAFPFMERVHDVMSILQAKVFPR